MNRNSSGLLTLNKAVTGFLNFKTAEGLAQRTLYSYERILVKWVEYMKDRKVTAITSQDLTAYLTWLRTDYTPRRITGNNDRNLATKTIRNIWGNLSAWFKNPQS